MSHEETAGIVWEILSALLQIGGFFLAVAGCWIIILDLVGGRTLAIDEVGPKILIAGIVALATGVSMDRVQTRREEQSYLLPSTPERSPAWPVSPTRTPKMFNCPSCGYENDDGGFFCIACNTPLWPAGKPTSSSPPRSMVMHKIGRALMIRKVKRVVVYVILAFVISAPFAASLAVGYSAVNQSKLVLAFSFFHAPYSLATGILYVAWMIYSPGFGASLSASSTNYDVRFNNLQLPATGCPNPDRPASLRAPWDGGCAIVIPHVNGSQLNGTTVTVKVTALTGLLIYRQQITRSVSVLCDSRCFEFDGPWLY